MYICAIRIQFTRKQSLTFQVCLQRCTLVNSSLEDTNFISLHKNGIFCNFRDIWQNMFRAPDFEVSFRPFDIDDCLSKKKNTRQIFFRKLHLCRISSKSVIHALICYLVNRKWFYACFVPRNARLDFNLQCASSVMSKLLFLISFFLRLNLNHVRINMQFLLRLLLFTSI